METTTMGSGRFRFGKGYWGYIGIMETKMETTTMGSGRFRYGKGYCG